MHCLPVLGVSAQDDRNALLVTAEQHYAAGDWPAAAAAFEQLIATGVTDPAIYINLGHAYRQQGSLGKALLNYRRAEQFAPRDSQLLSYIAAIIAARRDQTVPSDSLVLRLYRLTADLLTTGELITLTLAVWTVGFGLISFRLLKRLQPRARSTLTWIIRVWVVILLPLLAFLSIRFYLEIDQPQAVLTAEQAIVRSGPAEYYMDLFAIHAAAEMRILTQQDDWVLVELGEGRLGWLPASEVEAVRFSG
jgi:uncharacterized protein YgiM (DUF1202 family)